MTTPTSSDAEELVYPADVGVVAVETCHTVILDFNFVTMMHHSNSFWIT
jgi:hypothetical protein